MQDANHVRRMEVARIVVVLRLSDIVTDALPASSRSKLEQLALLEHVIAHAGILDYRK